MLRTGVIIQIVIIHHIVLGTEIFPNSILVKSGQCLIFIIRLIVTFCFSLSFGRIFIDIEYLGWFMTWYSAT